MLHELIRNKVHYRIFDRTYANSSGIYSYHKYNDAAKLAQVNDNITNISNELGVKHLQLLNQVHGDDIYYTSEDSSTNQPKADASCTDKKNVALGILTADCVPVLLASADGKVIGAAHCGWKSAKLGIIPKLQEKMQELGAKSIMAVIGPAIAQKSYEVDMSYYKAFIEQDNSTRDLFIPSNRENHFMFNLVGYVKRSLENTGVSILHDFSEDTYSNPNKYPSYRRSYHEGSTYSQNILSTIVIK
jgi:YfiH family protein